MLAKEVKMFARPKTLLLILLVAGVVCGGTVRTQSFYPLKVGNQWVYRDSSWLWGGGGVEIDTSIVTIVSDTVFTNGRRYFRFSTNEAVGGLFARAAPETVFYYNHYQSFDVPFYLLNVPVGSQWSVNYGPFFFASLAVEGQLTWFGIPTTAKEFHYDGLVVTWVILSEKFGPVAIWDQYDPPGAYNTLRLLIGAVISDTAYGTLVSVKPQDNLPMEFALYQNYPNPFNPVTTIQFSVPHKTTVSLTVIDILGRKVAGLLDDQLSAGTHTVRWDATGVAGGVYLYQLRTPEHVDTKRMLLIK